MKLQTQIPLKQEKDNLIDYNSKLLLLGSCFSQNIASKFNYFKFQSKVNPFGILFHPKAIETLIVEALNNKEYTTNDIFFNNEQWHCFNAHSKLSNSSQAILLQELNTAIKQTNKQITNATHIIITLGTAWVYNNIETNTIVANCHKVSQKKFSKQLLSVSKIETCLKNIVAKIKEVNTKTSIIFTVSPVRHLKDGFIENTQSKAHLLTAIHNLIQTEHQIKYFPSYEIMLDELRDYRFYNDDMLHPSAIAVNYIWEKFQSVWMSSATNSTLLEIETIQKGLAHKAFNPNSLRHKKFLSQLDKKIEAISLKYSHIKFK